MQTKLNVYCTCRKPQNPDELMIQCDACEDWLHCTSRTPFLCSCMFYVGFMLFFLQFHVFFWFVLFFLYLLLNFFSLAKCVGLSAKEQKSTSWVCPNCKKKGIKLV